MRLNSGELSDDGGNAVVDRGGDPGDRRDFCDRAPAIDMGHRVDRGGTARWSRRGQHLHLMN